MPQPEAEWSWATERVRLCEFGPWVFPPFMKPRWASLVLATQKMTHQPATNPNWMKVRVTGKR